MDGFIPRTVAPAGRIKPPQAVDPANAHARREVAKLRHRYGRHPGERRTCEGWMPKPNAKGGPKGERQDGASNPF